MIKLLQNLIPRKTHFVGVDVGAFSIKMVEIKIHDDQVEVMTQHTFPSPAGVWTDSFNEEDLVFALSQAGSPLNEVVSCIGGEKVITRSVRFPVMSDKELAASVEIEISKNLPISTEQMIIRHTTLATPAKELAGKGASPDFAGSQPEGQSVLLMAVPTTLIYQYYSIFSRAGLTVTAFDLQAFALWRVFGRDITGTVALVDFGAKTSRFVVVRNGTIRFIRQLPVGGEALTGAIVEALGLERAQAQQYKGESSVSRNSDIYMQGGPLRRIGDVLREGLTEFVKEMRRSLSFCSAQEGLNVERIILSGGTSKLKGIADYCHEMLELETTIGVTDAMLPVPNFDPSYAVALGLAMRGIGS
ncbi:MAG: pilus assembly protein PilM [Thermacetogeniaceae bacterium]